jgi:hypothetical protein
MVPARVAPGAARVEDLSRVMRQRAPRARASSCEPDDLFGRSPFIDRPTSRPASCAAWPARHDEIHRAGGLLGRQVLVPGQFVQKSVSTQNAG